MTPDILERDLTAQQARNLLDMAFPDDHPEYIAPDGVGLQVYCRHVNDLITLRGGKAGCLACGRNADIGKQIWKCYCCGTCRVWGLDFPVDVSSAKLNCIRCRDVSSHRFIMVTRNR